MTTLDVNYVLANQAGYKFKITDMTNNVYDPSAYWTKENFPDIEVTRPNTTTDLSKLDTRCLVSVNGFYYPTIYTNGQLFVPNATKSMLKSKANHIGILSFNSMGLDLDKIPLTQDMFTGDPNFSLYEKVIITFNKDLQYPALIINGYMIFEDPEFFYPVASNAYVLRLDRLNYIEKLYELNRYRDIFTELGIPVSPNDPSVIDGDVARSDAMIMKFLSTFNCFLVNFPYPLVTEKIYLEHSNIPSFFRTEIEPTHLLVGGYGKTLEYYKKQTLNTKYNVSTLDAYYNQFLFSSKPYNEIALYNDHRVVGSTYRLAQAYFMKLSLTAP